jgi:hypothetical protein
VSTCAAYRKRCLADGQVERARVQTNHVIRLPVVPSEWLASGVWERALDDTRVRRPIGLRNFARSDFAPSRKTAAQNRRLESRVSSAVWIGKTSLEGRNKEFD